jgi:hypothetical protein
LCTLTWTLVLLTGITSILIFNLGLARRASRKLGGNRETVWKKTDIEESKTRVDKEGDRGRRSRKETKEGDQGRRSRKEIKEKVDKAFLIPE